MCNGFSTRTTRGGAIAILRPFESQSENYYQVTLEEVPGTPTGCAGRISLPVGTEETKRDGHMQALKSCWLQIHRDGDLVPRGVRDTIPTLHKFPMDKLVWQTESRSTEASTGNMLGPISLTVGNEGVIGRRMSIMDGESGIRVAEGVIGWN
ncbi:hypothetical protein FQN54_009536 [Arachnomyces sp. PD_36]|nr:hypothetical protein FQN54_009536 [Arachnomyces sp. PD_36]